MKKLLGTLTIALAFVLSLSQNAFAQSKIAVVDVSAVVSKSVQVQTLKKERIELFDSRNVLFISRDRGGREDDRIAFFDAEIFVPAL